MTTNATVLSPERYFACIDADTERLAEMGERGLDPDVPSCPDWTVADVISHVAMVYEHKVRVMADNAWPKPWPPADFAEREPVDFLREAKDDLFAEFARHDLSEQTTTFGTDTTIAFWLRRMALEIAVHRYDGELAHADTTPVPDDIALDGIDEILKITLAGPWWTDYATEHQVNALVAVESGGLRWICDAQPNVSHHHRRRHHARGGDSARRSGQRFSVVVGPGARPSSALQWRRRRAPGVSREIGRVLRLNR